VNFLVDENMPRSLAVEICTLGFQAQHVKDIGLLGRPGPEVMQTAIGPTTIIPHRLTALQEPAPPVRQNAAIALSKLGNDTYIDKLSAPPDQGA
jgi:HEAT repeat protein